MRHDLSLHGLAARAVDLTDEEERAAISDYVARHPDGSLFHRPAWLRAVEEGCGQEAVYLVAEDAGGVIQGVLPLTSMHHMLFGRALVSSGFGVGGGIVADSDAARALLAEEAKELARCLSIGSVEMRGQAYDLGYGWHVEEGAHENYACDLAQDDEAQLTSIRRKQRAEVRKGLANELTIETGNNDVIAALHYDLYAASVRNLGTPVFPRALFDAMRKEFGDDAEILLVLSPEGEPLSAVLSFYHKGTVMPYWGGGNKNARAWRANEVMYYALMCHARKERGCTRFDFGRSKIGSGSGKFKKNFGIEPEPLSYASWSADGKTRDISPTSGKYSKMVETWKRLPLPVANFVGPWLARGLG